MYEHVVHECIMNTSLEQCWSARYFTNVNKYNVLQLYKYTYMHIYQLKYNMHACVYSVSQGHDNCTSMISTK